MLAHPVRYLLPYVPFAMAAPAYARCFPPFPFIVLCAPVGGKCAPDAHWRRVALARNAAAPLCLAVVFVFRCGMAPARACGYFYPLGMAAHGHVKALRRKVALEIRRSKVVA
jgi:hypothetical protein